MQKLLISTVLPPKLRGDSLGSITVILKRFQTDYPQNTTCRISFWGQEEDQFVDIGSNEVEEIHDPISIEYPLVGTMEGIRRYFADMNILPIPIFRKIDTDGGTVLLVGQGNVLLPHVLCQLNQSLRTTHGTKSMLTGSQNIQVPLISIPNAMELNHPYQCQQIGELNLEFVLKVHICKMSDDRSGMCVPYEVDTHPMNVNGKCITIQQCASRDALEGDTQSESVHFGEEMTNPPTDSISSITLPPKIKHAIKISTPEKLSHAHATSLSEFGLDDGSFSLATEDDSILMDAMMEGRYLKSSRQAVPCGHQVHSSKGTSTILTPLENVKPKQKELALYPSLPVRWAEQSHIVANVRFARLNIQSLSLSTRLLQPVIDLTREAGCLFKVQCWLKFQAPPLVMLPLNQTKSCYIPVFERVIENKNVPMNYNQKPRGHKTKTSITSIHGSHEISHSTLWNLQYQDDSDVRTWLHSSLDFDLIANVERLDEKGLKMKRHQGEQLRFAEKELRGSNVCKKGFKLASAKVKLDRLFSRRSLELDSKVPFCSTRTRTMAKSGFVDFTLFLLPDQCKSDSLQKERGMSRSNGTSAGLRSTSSLDLIDDTIISEASANLLSEHCSLALPAAKNTGTVGANKHESTTITRKISSMPLWMYFSLSLKNEDISSRYTFIRIKTSYENRCSLNTEQFMRTKTSSADGTEEIIKMDRESGRTLHGKDFKWMTILNIGEYKVKRRITVTTEIWSHNAPIEDKAIAALNMKSTETKEDVLLGTITVQIRIPDHLTPSSIHPSLVKHDTLQVQDFQTKNQGDFQMKNRGTLPITLAIGLLRQVRSFASLTENAMVIQRWWVCICQDKDDLQKNSSHSVDSTKISSNESKYSSLLVSKMALLIQNLWRGKKRNSIRKRNEHLYLNTNCSPSKMNGTRKNDPSEFLSSQIDEILSDQNKLRQHCDTDAVNQNSTVQDSTTRTTRNVGTSPKNDACGEQPEFSLQNLHNANKHGIGVGRREIGPGTFYSKHEAVIHFGECSGVREMITLWSDNEMTRDSIIPFTFGTHDWISSGILVSFSILSRARFDPSSISSAPKIVHFSSGISRMSISRRLIALNHEFSVLIDGSPEMKSYLQSEKLVCKLWFVPVVTDAMLGEYPKSSADQVVIVPKEASLICTTSCPLTVLMRDKDVMSYVCPWTYAHDLSFDHVIGKVQIDIGRKGLRNSDPTITLCPNEGFDTHPVSSDVFDWGLSDKIEAALSQTKRMTETIACRSKCEPSLNERTTRIASTEKEHEQRRTTEEIAAVSEVTAKRQSSYHEPVKVPMTNADWVTYGHGEKADLLRDPEEDSWSGRKLDSVLASLVLATNALSSTNTNKVGEGEEAQSKGTHEQKKNLNCKEISAKSCESPLSFQRGDTTSESKSINQPRASLKPLEPPPMKTKNNGNEESLCEEIQKEFKVIPSGNSSEDESDMEGYNLPGESKDSFSFCVQKAEMKESKYQELCDSPETRSMEAMDKKISEDSSDDSVFQERIRSRIRIHRKSSSSSSSTSSDFDFVPRGMLFVSSHNNENTDIRVGISSDDSSSDSSSMFAPRDTQRYNEKSREVHGTQRLPYSQIDSDYSSDSSTMS